MFSYVKQYYLHDVLLCMFLIFDSIILREEMEILYSL